MNTYWCGWTVPHDLPDEHMAELWPENMRGWCTGDGDGYATWTGAVRAIDAAAAWQTVLGCFGASADRIGKRWEPELKPEGWRPGDRFPGGGRDDN